MSTLFISHKAAEKDNRVAQQIVARLEEQEGHKSVFLDLDPEKGIVGGRSWEQTLYRKVRACRAVVALLSNQYLKSHWCFAELALSRMERKHLIALEIEELDPKLIPQILTGVQRINFHADPEDGFKRLFRSLEDLDLLGVSGEWSPNQCPYLGLRTYEEKHAPLFFGRGEETAEGVRLLGRGAPGLFMVLGSSGSGKSSLVRAGIVPRLRREEDRWLIVGPFRPRLDPFAELADALEGAWEDYATKKAKEEAKSAGVRARWRQRLGAGAGRGEAPAEPGSAAALDADERVHRLLAQLEELAGAPPTAGGEPFRSFLDLSLEELREIFAGKAVARTAAAPASGVPTLVEIADELRRASGRKGASVLVIVDQFEELLGRGAPADAAGAFLGRMREAIEYLDRPLMVLGTMRSDFLELFQRNPELAGIDFQKISVGPMGRQGMRRVIKEPARLGAVEVSDELVEQLLDDTGTPDALPLLSFTLAALWEKRDEEGRLSADRYKLMGGLHGAVAREAQDLLDALDEAEQERLREAFLEMARTEDGRYARRPVPWSHEKISRVEPVLRKFLERRLLVTSQVEGGESTVEVAHEALFRSWPPLKGWLDQHRSEFLLKEQLARDADAWEESGRPASMLWRGGRLAQAVELMESLSDVQREFVQTSDDVAQEERRKEEERRRRELEQARRLEREQRRAARFFRALGALAFVGLLVVAGFLWYAVEKRREAEDQARVAVARNWVDQDPTRAALVLLEVGDPEKAAATVELLSRALREPLSLAELRGHADEVKAVAFDPRGERLVSASADRTARIWRIRPDGTPMPTAGGDVEPVALVHPDHVLAAAFSPDGARVITGCKDGAARIWNADGSPLDSNGGGEGDEGGRRVEVRSLVLLHGGEVTSAAFSPDGRRIVTGSTDGTARLWNADGTPYRPPEGGAQALLDLEPLVSTQGAAGIHGVDWSPDGRRVVVAVADKTAWIWTVDSGEIPACEEPRYEDCLEPRHGGAVFGAVFAPGPRAADAGTPGGAGAEGDRIVTASKDGTARVWSRRPDGGFEPVAELVGHGGDVYEVAVSPVDGSIVTASDDRRALLWDADGRRVMSEDGSVQVAFRHEGEITGAAFSPAGDLVATASKDHSIRLWRPAGGLEPAFLPQERPTDAFFRGPDEVVIASEIGEFRDGAFGLPFFQTWKADGSAERFELDLPEEILERWTLATVFSPAGDRIVTVSLGGTARLWRGDGTPLARSDGGGQVVLGPGQAVAGAAFSPAGDRIVTAGKDGKARVWNADGAPFYSNGRQVVLDHGAAELAGAAFGPDGSRLVTASADGTARLWRADGASLPAADGGDVVLRHEEGVSRAQFGPDGDLVATTSGSGAWLWHADGRPVTSGEGGHQVWLRHDHAIRSLAFSPRGDRIVTGSLDETARLWSVGPGDPLVLRLRDADVKAVSFAPDGERVIAARSPTEEGAPPAGAVIWRLSYDVLGRIARAATAVCLDPAFREKSLREEPVEARENSDRCRRCLGELDGATAAADPAAAYADYRRCYR